MLLPTLHLLPLGHPGCLPQAGFERLPWPQQAPAHVPPLPALLPPVPFPAALLRVATVLRSLLAQATAELPLPAAAQQRRLPQLLRPGARKQSLQSRRPIRCRLLLCQLLQLLQPLAMVALQPLVELALLLVVLLLFLLLPLFVPPLRLLLALQCLLAPPTAHSHWLPHLQWAPRQRDQAAVEHRAAHPSAWPHWLTSAAAAGALAAAAAAMLLPDAAAAAAAVGAALQLQSCQTHPRPNNWLLLAKARLVLLVLLQLRPAAQLRPALLPLHVARVAGAPPQTAATSRTPRAAAAPPLPAALLLPLPVPAARTPGAPPHAGRSGSGPTLARTRLQQEGGEGKQTPGEQPPGRAGGLARHKASAQGPLCHVGLRMWGAGARKIRVVQATSCEAPAPELRWLGRRCGEPCALDGAA